MSSELQVRLQTALGDAYRLERELARGGMSRLFLATEASLNRQVVVKLLPPDFTSQVSTDRFKQEIELAAHLQHPNILPVLAAGTREGLLYYVIPYVAGESLRHRLTREGRLPIADAIRILHEVADALAYAHAEGVIHRDIKPENILLEGSHAVLTDFGVARALGEPRSGDRLTDTGLALGTPGYMAPEQAAGDRQIDGRADVYALAVVGYEMLAGAPPFAAASAQAMLAAHLTQTPRPLTDLRPEAPADAAGAILRALAKDPNARLGTAAEFRDALGPAHGDIRIQHRSRRLVQGLGAALVLLLGGAAALFLRRSSPTALDPTLLAVAPFDALGPELELWREGLVDLLSRNLDGAGPLRTVSPTVVIRRWSGRADPASATALGRSTGAGLTVFGNLVATGGDSVRLAATIIDVARDRLLGEVQLRGSIRHMDQLADSLTVSLLRELGRTRDVVAVRTASLGATSLPALKAFLEGERLYRNGRWDSAQAAYRRALTHDSVFVPALRHLGLSLSWRAIGDTEYISYLLRAGELNRGLPRRDSILVAGDSLLAALQLPDIHSSVRRTLSPRLFKTLADATRLYPDDPEAWYALGESRYHLGWPVVVDDAEMLAAFDRAIGLDSNFTPAYVHATELGLILHGLEGWNRYARPYLRLRPSDDFATGTRLLDAIFASPSRAHTDSLLRSARQDELEQALFTVWRFPDSAETAVRIARALDAGWGRSPGQADPVLRRDLLTLTLAFRGHFRQAEPRVDEKSDWTSGIPAEIALVRGGDPKSVDAKFQSWLRREPLWPTADPQLPGRLFSVLRWWADRKDALSLATYISRVDSAQRTLSKPRSREMTQYVLEAASAYRFLSRGDTAAALRRFQSLPRDITWGGLERVTEGQLLFGLGRDKEAIAVLEGAFPLQWASPFKALVQLYVGRARERSGDRDRAIRSYQYLADVWQHADPELQPYVAEARQALARLTSESQQ